MINGEVTEVNAVEKLGELASIVRNDLVSTGLINVDQKTPSIALLEAVMALGQANEGARTRFLAMMRDWPFTVSTSREYRVQWNRRWYTFGPVPIQVTLGPATKLIESCVIRNSRILGYENNTSFTSATDSGTPVMIHWGPLVINNPDAEAAVESPYLFSDENTSEAQVEAGPTYGFLLQRHRGVLEHRSRKVQLDPTSVLEPSNVGGKHMLGQFAGHVPAGVNFRDISGSVTDGFSPRGQVASLPQAAKEALLGSQPQTAAGTLRTTAPAAPPSGGDTAYPPPPPPRG